MSLHDDKSKVNDISLSLEEERFCFLYAKTHRLSQSIAQAYPDMQDEEDAVTGRFTRLDYERETFGEKLLSRPEVADRVEYHRRRAQKLTNYTFEQHLASLMDIRDLCLANEEYKVALGAETTIGKIQGWHVDRRLEVKVDANKLSREEAERQLESFLKANPRMARLAKKVAESAGALPEPDKEAEADFIDAEFSVSPEIGEVNRVSPDDKRSRDSDEV